MKPVLGYLLLSLMLLPSAAAVSAQAESEDVRFYGPIKPGSDFCFTRTYEPAHLRHHPGQLVRTIQIMGRNAGRGGPHDGKLWATLHVSFRDKRFPITFSGACNADNEDRSRFICKFHSLKSPDVIGQDLHIAAQKSGDLQAEATGDWRVIRRDDIDSVKAPYGEVTTDDRIFFLTRSPLSACRFPKGHWTAQGPTERMYSPVP
jgi:hypothetical protein